MSDSNELGSPVSSSKLVPAAAPTVSAWGKMPETTQPATPAPIKKEQWPTVDVVLAKDPSATATKEAAKPTPPKAKSGKEKWVPYQATIILPTGNNNNQQQKKKGNNNGGGNGNANGNANGNTKKKQQQQQQQQGQNSNNQNKQNNGKQKKDGQAQKNNQNGQKKTDGNNNQNGNQQKKKNNGQSNGSNKSTKSVTEGVASLNLKNDKDTQKSREITVESSSIKSPSPTTNPAVAATTPREQHAQPAATSPNGDDNGSTVTTAPSMSAATDSTSATSPSAQHANIQKQNKKPQPQPYQQQYQPQPQQQQPPQPQQYQPQPNQHRNSEPFAGGNGNYFNPGNRGRKQNKHFNNTRHSVAGPGYNMPYMNYNYGNYMPMMAPNQFGYVPPLNNFVKPTDSRSHSQSPSRADFTSTLNPIPNVPGVAPFVPQPMMFNPYGTDSDPLTAVINQLNYYFSTENLGRDFYLRRQMNSQGYVPLKKLIQFYRLQHLTGGDYEMMLTALKRAPSLEVHNEKVRVIGTWAQWVLPYDNRDEVGKVEEENEEQNNENEESQA